jgi:hypothetical protein
MGRRNTLAVLCAGIATACGGGSSGGAGFGGGADAALGVVQLLHHSPADGAVQIARGIAIDLEFDAVMALDSFADEDTWLRAAGSSTNVAGTFALGSPGRVRFTPRTQLAAETDYVFQLSALTCDETGRILDVTTAFTFRTFDATPPQLVSVDVANGAQDQSRSRTFTATFSEPVAPASVSAASCYLRDGFGIRYDGTRTVAGTAVTLDPSADLPGDRQFTLVLTGGITDSAGNALAATSTTSFRTVADTDAPAVVDAWPPMQSTGVSPRVQPTFAFDESMDPDSVEAASLLFQDEFGGIVAFRIDASADQRRLRVVPNAPLHANRRYTLAFLLGGAAATDVSGNVLEGTQARTFTTGADATPPAIATSMPGAGETRVPGSVVATVTFDEDLDPAWVGTDTVSLLVAGAPWTALVERPTPRVVRVTPVLTLPTNAVCTLLLRGGQDGLHDLAGNVLPADTTIAFTTSADAGTPGVMVLPADGAAGIARNVRVAIVFDAPMDPVTLTSSTLAVTDDLGTPLPGALTIDASGRAAHFTPSSAFTQQTWYRVRVAGGSAGVRRTSGNWLPADVTSRFRTGTGDDSIAPQVTATVNGVHPSRATGLVLPPSGFTVDVTATDAGTQVCDMGAVDVVLTGAGSGPSGASLRGSAVIGHGTLRVQVPSSTPLAAGAWTLSVRVPDLAGNVGQSTSLAFTVAQPDTGALPFERTQVVWVRTDLDRDGNGTADFADDMLRLGFATAGDPLGTNAWMGRLVLDGVLAQCARLYGRGDRGEPVDAGSVGIRFTTRQPIRVPHMQMALGGLDPEGARGRVYGDESSGVLGRAYYDYRNGNVAERNIATAPGLGVFPAEMWLYQTRIHTQVWPSYTTAFAQRFRPLCADMGGVPAGAHALDAVVLSPSFDYATATTAQRARWQTIMDAADDWATVIGIILAHEVGHSVGLVAPGPSPTGLFGDSSLHDSYAGASEVMAPSVGYEAMTSLAYAFRDLDLAYLRQRVLLR